MYYIYRWIFVRGPRNLDRFGRNRVQYELYFACGYFARGTEEGEGETGLLATRPFTLRWHKLLFLRTAMGKNVFYRQTEIRSTNGPNLFNSIDKLLHDTTHMLFSTMEVVT